MEEYLQKKIEYLKFRLIALVASIGISCLFSYILMEVLASLRLVISLLLVCLLVYLAFKVIEILVKLNRTYRRYLGSVKRRNIRDIVNN